MINQQPKRHAYVKMLGIIYSDTQYYSQSLCSVQQYKKLHIVASCWTIIDILSNKQ
jgi:hypothetical protein